MYRVGTSDFCRADDGRDIEVAIDAARRTNTDLLIREPDVQRVFIGFRVHRDRSDAELSARNDDTESDLAAIRDEDLLEHSRLVKGLPCRSRQEGNEPGRRIARVRGAGPHDGPDSNRYMPGLGARPSCADASRFSRVLLA